MNKHIEHLWAHRSTLFLKIVIIVIVLVALALCIFAFPNMAKSMLEEFPTLPNAPYFMSVFYVSTIPFFIGLFYAWKILTYIDKNIAFSDLSVKALRKIKYLAVIISIILASGMAWIFPFAQVDDAPGAILMWTLIASTPLVVAVFAALLEKLLRNAIQLQTENDLTV